jgi:hypothetical protein
MPETVEAAEKHYPLTTLAIVAPIVGWLVPGGGHLIQKKWIRGALLMLSVVCMFALGIAMKAKVYQGNTGDLLDILGFLGDAGGGGLYLLARAMDWGTGAINTVYVNYGSIFLIVAGLLNIVSAVDAHQIALGKKP